ncbi:MAG: MaoC family dehydratase [Candidatus Promineifilaceae bacterium]|jgi:acyl dehydratase
MKPKLGQVITGSRVFTQADFDKFAVLSGDDNPIHVDPEFAARSRFGATVAHGMLLYGILCGVIRQHFPDSAQIDQRMMFTAPTFAGEEVNIRCEVVEIDPNSNQFKLDIHMVAAGGKIVCDGDSTLRWRPS